MTKNWIKKAHKMEKVLKKQFSNKNSKTDFLHKFLVFCVQNYPKF